MAEVARVIFTLHNHFGTLMQVKASCLIGVGITSKAELDKKGKAFEGKQAAFTIEVCGLISNSLTMA